MKGNAKAVGRKPGGFHHSVEPRLLLNLVHPLLIETLGIDGVDHLLNLRGERILALDAGDVVAALEIEREVRNLKVVVLSKDTVVYGRS